MKDWIGLGIVAAIVLIVSFGPAHAQQCVDPAVGTANLLNAGYKKLGEQPMRFAEGTMLFFLTPTDDQVMAVYQISPSCLVVDPTWLGNYKPETNV